MHRNAFSDRTLPRPTGELTTPPNSLAGGRSKGKGKEGQKKRTRRNEGFGKGESRGRRKEDGRGVSWFNVTYCTPRMS